MVFVRGGKRSRKKKVAPVGDGYLRNVSRFRGMVREDRAEGL